VFCVVRTSGGIERDQAELQYVVMPRQEGSMLVVRPDGTSSDWQRVDGNNLYILNAAGG